MARVIRQFKPGIALTISSVLAFAILIALGTWQARKVGPKTALLQTISANMAAAPVPLAADMTDPGLYQYRHVVFDGVRKAPPVKVFGMNLKGKPGFYLYAPVETPEDLVIIVNFGWMPLEINMRPPMPTGMRTYTGVLMANPEPGPMTPENDLKADAWYLADIYALADRFGYDPATIFPLRLFSDHVTEEQKWPLGGQVRVDIPNNHFEYAVTWYGLALVLLVIYILLGIKRAEA